MASFDLIPIQSFLQKRLEMTPKNPINANFEALGFVSIYSVINLNTVLVLLFCFPVLAIFELILRLMTCKYPVKVSMKLKKNLYWNSSITLFRESFIIILICGLINLRVLTYNTTWETISSLLTLLMIMMVIIIPIVILVATLSNFFQLAE